MKDNSKTTAPATVNSLDALKRQLETEMASGADYGKTLQDLATAIAYSVLKKVADPQRKAGKAAPVKTYATAPSGETNSNDGAKHIQTLRRGIAEDRSKLDSIEYAAGRAWTTAYNADGEFVQTFNAAAMKDFDKLTQNPLSDGIDLVQTAALAIMEQAAAHGGASGWLDKPYTARRLDKRVVIRSDDSAAWKETETTPIQEVYRAIRALIQRNKAISIDPANAYTYIETETDGEQTFRRLPRLYDLGAYSADSTELYTVDSETVTEFDALVARMNLTSRQAQILRLRMQGYGYKAIATALGITKRPVITACAAMQKKAIAIGLAPAAPQAPAAHAAPKGRMITEKEWLHLTTRAPIDME